VVVVEEADSAASVAVALVEVVPAEAGRSSIIQTKVRTKNKRILK
jgi:hypothetical protein